MPSSAVDTSRTDRLSIHLSSHFLNTKTRNHPSSFSYFQAFLAFFSVFGNSSDSINVLVKQFFNQDGAVEKVVKIYSTKRPF